MGYINVQTVGLAAGIIGMLLFLAIPVYLLKITDKDLKKNQKV